MENTNRGSEFIATAEKPQSKRNVERRCPICDRGHMCFATAIDIEPAVLEEHDEIELGSVHVLAKDIVGSWQRTKTRILAGTQVVVKNLRADATGGLRAMIELPDGDVYWVGSAQLTRGI